MLSESTIQKLASIIAETEKIISTQDLVMMGLKSDALFLNSRKARLDKEEAVRKQDFILAAKHRDLEKSCEEEIERHRIELNQLLNKRQ